MERYNGIKVGRAREASNRQRAARADEIRRKQEQENEFIGISAQIIQDTFGFSPKASVILGSGLGGVAAELLGDTKKISYTELPGWPVPSVEGHAGEIVGGKLGNARVLLMGGRQHFYEGGGLDSMRVMIRTLRAIGTQQLVITSAVGSLNPKYGPGSLVLVKDHLGVPGMDPLIGPNDESWGPRFPNMGNAYTADARTAIKKIAAENNINLGEGTFCWHPGPNFESPSEIKRFEVMLGDAQDGINANVVGMSVVPAVVFANHCQPSDKNNEFCQKPWDVSVIGGVVNLAQGLSKITISHEQTMTGGALVAPSMTKLLLPVIQR